MFRRCFNANNTARKMINNIPIKRIIKNPNSLDILEKEKPLIAKSGIRIISIIPINMIEIAIN